MEGVHDQSERLGVDVASLDAANVEDASEESVEELADADQALEAAAVEGIEDAADHPERSVHTHIEHPRAEDVPPKRGPD